MSDKAAAFLKWCSENSSFGLLSIVGGIASVASFLQSSPAAQRWWAKVRLNEIAKACGTAGESRFRDPKRRHDHAVICTRTFHTVLSMYGEHAAGYDNGFVLVICSASGWGKTSCLQAFVHGKLDFLSERAVYVDLQDKDKDVYRTFVEELGFPWEVVKDNTGLTLVCDLLKALSGEVFGVRGMDEVKQAYEDFVEKLNPAERAELAVMDGWGSFRGQVRKFGERLNFPCGSRDDANDDSSMVNQLPQPLPSDDASLSKEAPGPKAPGRILEAKFPGEVSAGDYKAARPDIADEKPIAVLCIDNIPKLDDEMKNFFRCLKEAIWVYSHNNRRVVVLVTTRHKETAEELRKLNDNQKITLVKGSYTGNVEDHSQSLEYNNFAWSKDDMLQHLKTKYSDLLVNNEVQRILEEAAECEPVQPVRIAESRARGYLREVRGVKL